MKHETKHNMTKKINNSREFPIVLKTIINDAMRDKTIVDDNAKKIRARLRVALNDAHVKNTSWIAMNARDYDRIRCAFDAKYAQRLVDARKRNTRKNVTPSNETNVEA